MQEVRTLIFAAVVLCGIAVPRHVSARTTEPRAIANRQATAEQILQRALDRIRSTARGGNGRGDRYSFTLVKVREERDAHGQVREHKRQLQDIVFDGDSYTRQARDGRSTGLSQGRTALSRNEYVDLLTPQMLSNFLFALEGRTNCNGRVAYEVTFAPRPGLPPAREFRERMLRQARGVLWIDAEEYEIVRAQANIDSEVPVGGGWLGALKRGAFSLERIRLETGQWVERLYRSDYEARKFSESKRVITQAEFVNFQPLRTGG